METKVFEYSINGNAQQFAISLKTLIRAKGAGGDVAKVGLNSSVLNSLSIEMSAPNATGEKPCFFTTNNDVVNIFLTGLKRGLTCVVIRASYGTFEGVAGMLLLHVTEEVARTNEPIEFELPIVSTIGDGTSGLVVDATPTEGSENPVQSGGVYTALAGKQPAGSYADGAVYTAPAEGHATIADDKLILGAYPAADAQDAYALIVGIGTDPEHPSTAFAISRTGNLVLFNAGEAVELTPAKLAALIA